jgi:hypothetical protein
MHRNVRGEYPHLPPTGSSGVPWCWHPRLSCLLHGACRTWRRSRSRVTAQGISDNPGRGARMPPGLKLGFPDGRDVGRVHRDPGRSGGRGTNASPGSSSGAWALERRGGAVLCGLGRRAQERCGCPARPHPNLAVTLRDMGGRGERSPSRRSVRQKPQHLMTVDVVPSGAFCATVTQPVQRSPLSQSRVINLAGTTLT